VAVRVVACVTVLTMTLPPFWTLVERHGAELMRHARRLAGDDAEDVLQEAFMRALRSYDRLERSDHLRAWLYRITTTTAFDHTARNRGEVLMGSIPDASNEDGFYDDAFESLLSGLSERASEAMTHRFVADLTYSQMAHRLGCSEQAARQRVSSAVRELRRRMA
jgi:RNA polymerase sigma-70 factor (ECF subfamily)